MRRHHTSPSPSPTIAKGTPIRETGTMTPPPSTQVPKSYSKSAQAKSKGRRENSLASPPPTLKISPPINSGVLFGEIPSLETVQKMDEGQLRGLVTELLPAFGEARVSAAHSKLQHSLLSIETEEAAKRAAVEHEATRREVQVLQEGSPVHRNYFSPRSPQASMQRNLQLSLSHCRELQQENMMLEKRLRSSKKLVAQLDEQNADLKDNVHLLRQRIKENREHLNEMHSNGAISINNTPNIGYSTPLHNQTSKTPATAGRAFQDSNLTARSQDPLDTLLLASQQVMNREANSVPSSPQQFRTKKLHSQHIRGAHSLSSLPTTPLRSRPVTADNTVVTPISHAGINVSSSAPDRQLVYDGGYRAREDRESTISASENEEEPSRDEEMLGSQASQAATGMLRRSLGSQNGRKAASSQNSESSKAMQAKLFGQVTKPPTRNTKSLKRGIDSSSYDHTSRSNKKARAADSRTERIGLGIKT